MFRAMSEEPELLMIVLLIFVLFVILGVVILAPGNTQIIERCMELGKLTEQQRWQMMHKTFEVFTAIKKAQPNVVTWISAEPLTFDLGWFLTLYSVDWIVIGAASEGRNYYPPDVGLVQSLVNMADYSGTKVFFKGNMKSLPWAAQNWREEFPR